MYSPGQPTSPHPSAQQHPETPEWSRFCCRGDRPSAASPPQRAHAPASPAHSEPPHPPQAARKPCHIASAPPASRCSPALPCSRNRTPEPSSSPPFHPMQRDRLHRNDAPTPQVALPLQGVLDTPRSLGRC